VKIFRKLTATIRWFVLGRNFFIPQDVIYMDGNSLLARQDYQTWKTEGEITMEQRIREKIKEILATHKVSPLPDSTLAAIDRIKTKGEKELIRRAT